MTPVALQLGFETPVALVYWLIAAFAGGAFGAAIGALPAFCFTGFAVIAGEAANLVGLTGAPEGAALTSSGLTGLVGFGRSRLRREEGRRHAAPGRWWLPPR